MLFKRVFTTFFILVICLAALLVERNSCYASLILEGQLLDHGNKLSDGQTVKVTVRVYDDEFDGNLLFLENQEVIVESGRFLVTFEKGEVSIRKKTFGLTPETIWVELVSDGQVMLPRLNLAEIGTTKDLAGGNLRLTEAGLRTATEPAMVIDNKGVSLEGSAEGTSSLEGSIVSGVNTFDGSCGDNTGGYFSAVGEYGKGVYGKTIGNYGVSIYGMANGISGKGVYGSADNTGDAINYGGYFLAAGKSGRGVYGLASGSDGQGVYGKATGTSGKGVYGEASDSGNVTNVGGYFLAAGEYGWGIYGLATGSIGKGVYGMALSNGADRNYGGHFNAAGQNGIGAYGNASGATGVGVCGNASNTGTDINYGGYFTSQGIVGRGIHGEATTTSGCNYGGYFVASTASQKF